MTQKSGTARTPKAQ